MKNSLRCLLIWLAFVTCVAAQYREHYPDTPTSSRAITSAIRIIAPNGGTTPEI